MADAAHRWTDKQIHALERKISGLYAEAARDTQGKLNAFIAKYKRDDAKYRKQLQNGEITKETYRDWLAGQVFTGKRWRAMLEDLSQTMTHSGELAMQMVNDATPEAFAYNANWGSFTIEKAGGVNMGFGLYDQSTVTRLIRDDPTLLPPSRVEIPKEQRWNMQLITNQITQGIIQGEGLDTIAKRLQNVAVMDFSRARTHARTAMTGAQNAGRVQSYTNAQKLGINVRKKWLATLDSHTREAHRELDGQVVDNDKPFHSPLGEIMYPGDPAAAPANVYNCRCTLIADVVDYPSENAQRYDNETGQPMADMTYKEWLAMKTSKNAGTKGGESGIIKEGWSCATFQSQKSYERHKTRHLAQYDVESMDEYIGIARELLSSENSDDVDGFVNDAGALYKYRKSTNDFAIGLNGDLITMFKPDDGEDYWKGEKEREQNEK